MTQTFIGYLCKDITDLNNDAKSFTLAYNPPGRDKNAIFINCIMFKEITAAHIKMLPYIKKGALICISGFISENNVYESKNGEHKASLKLIVHNISFIPKAGNQIDKANEDMIYGTREINSSVKRKEEEDAKVLF